MDLRVQLSVCVETRRILRALGCVEIRTFVLYHRIQLSFHLQRVSTAEAQKFAKSVGALYFETSAKSKDGLAGIQRMFADLVRALPASILRPPEPKDTIPDLRAREPRAGGGGGCPC